MQEPITIDTREYVFPIFSVLSDDGAHIRMEGRKFLGTGFFVTKRGDAITASHVIPKEVESGRRLVAIVVANDKETVCWINQAAKFDSVDFALIQVNFTPTKYYPVEAREIFMGTDVEIMGVPEHETGEPGKKQMRILKGHVVTTSNQKLELSFPVPAGMSGSPVMVDGKVVGYATGRVSSEEIEEATEELETLTNQKEVIRITMLRRMTYYGLAYPLSIIANQPQDVFDGRTLNQLIAERNLL